MFQASLSKGLPAKLCVLCLRILQSAVALKDIALRSHQRIESLASKLKNTFSKEVALQESNKPVFVNFQPNVKMEEEEIVSESGESFDFPEPTEQILPMQTTDSSRFSCGMCSRTFTTEDNMNKHIQSDHTAPKEYKCNTCDKVFAKPGSLKLHLKTHKDELESIAETGPEDSKNEVTQTEEKKRKKKKAKKRKEGVFSCKTCDKEFSSKNSLNRHELIHEDIRQFSCDACGREFRHKHHAKIHIKSYHPEQNVNELLKEIEDE